MEVVLPPHAGAVVAVLHLVRDVLLLLLLQHVLVCVVRVLPPHVARHLRLVHLVFHFPELNLVDLLLNLIFIHLDQVLLSHFLLSPSCPSTHRKHLCVLSPLHR